MSSPADRNRSGHFLLTISLVGCAICVLTASPRLRGLLLNSALLAGGSLLICLPVGTLLAIAIAKTSVWGGRLLERMLIALLFVPLFVQAAAWQAVAGQGGWLTDDAWLSGWRGAIWVHGVMAVPWVVLFVAATLRKVPRELEETALQDAAAWRVLLRVSLPRASAGFIAAALWVTVICCSEITVTDLFQVRTFAEEIFTAANLGTLDGVIPTAQAIDTAEIPQFAAGELWLGTLAVACLLLAALVVIRGWVPIADFLSPSHDWVWHLREGRWALSLGTWLIAFVIMGAPLLGLVGKAGEYVTRENGQAVQSWSATKTLTMTLRSPWEHRRELSWSLLIGAVATVCATLLAVFIAWGLRTRWLPTLPTALTLALGFAIPGPLIGVWLIHCLNQPSDSWLAPLTWCYDHTILAPVLVQLLRALPLATLIIATQFASLPQDVLDSARTEGAGWWRQLGNIALPWGWPAVAAAAAMAMIVSVGELAATLLVVSPGVSTLSVRIFGLLHYGAEDRVAALCLLLAIVMGLATMLAWQLPKWVDGGEN